VHRAISLLLTVVWVGAGATKLVGLSSFEGVLSAHGVLPDRVIDLAWVVPAVEVVLGGVLFVTAAAPVRRGLLIAAACVSALLLLAFAVYVSRVDAGVFEAAGCGCGGIWGLGEVRPSRGAVIGVDVVLAALSLALLAVPKPGKNGKPHA